ncbi:ABC transporter permease subunit [Micromonospora polyrhachis]|uniref:ABC-type dipeptide/oligopeptide/nickel transport system permease subunit n=1 Tax=Micromonospora polyrhachis TaxID=1282883 RepID=A0A7W7SUL9_9ACTN|nr:ABC transporter permease subunit [Micromonospora polyrhachis]MBB4961258.1 ABC-type dipeptide/oligopeptide/nickel transport system permease subunit [Micromonospora polyrhachis]
MPRPVLPASLVRLVSRVVAAAGLLLVIGLLPWLARTDPALTVLRTRSAEQEPTAEVLAAIRREIGLDAGPLALLGRWCAGLPRGDLGTSWLSGEPVGPTLAAALSVSLTLMLGAVLVTLTVAALLTARTAINGARRRGKPGSGTTGALLAALPEFLLATVLATVVAVQWGWAPAQGWDGPASMVLPSLALGVPAGAILGRLLGDALPAAYAEPWASSTTAHGLPTRRIVAHALRRCLPPLLPQLALMMIGLTGGAVAVENLYAIPGLGRLTLNAAIAADLPVLQGAALALLLLGALVGGLAQLGRRLLLGPALRDHALPALHPPRRTASRWAVTVPVGLLLLLGTTIGLGLLRDPLTVDLTARLAAPSWAHPLGTDALGRDLLARLGHGALRTIAVALAVSAATLVIGILLGLLPRATVGLVDVANAVPPVVAGLLVVGVAGRDTGSAALAITLVSWAALASHTAALVEQERAANHLVAAVGLGAGRWHLLRRHLLPAVLPAVFRHAVLRVPAIALALASLGFLGLGTQPPAPEWGRLLAENLPYAERAPWSVLGPAAALALLGALAVGTAALSWRDRPTRSASATPAAAPARSREPALAGRP